MQRAPKRSNVKWFSERPKSEGRARKDRSPCQIASLRLHDLARLFRSRYGIVLPDDDAGMDDIEVAVNHLASLAHPRGRITKWLGLWAPWLTIAAQTALITKAIAGPQHWTADQLAWRLRLTNQEREMLGITTIGAVDLSKRERTKRRKQRAKERMAKLRQAKGATPRSNRPPSISKLKPWKVEGISRASWYRRQRKVRQAETPAFAP